MDFLLKRCQLIKWLHVETEMDHLEFMPALNFFWNHPSNGEFLDRPAPFEPGRTRLIFQKKREWATTSTRENLFFTLVVVACLLESYWRFVMAVS